MADEGWISWKRVEAEPIMVGDRQLRLASQALKVRWPNGGFVWQRPASVSVERQGISEEIGVIDVTRQAQLFLLGLAVFFGVIGLLVSLPRGSKGDKG